MIEQDAANLVVNQSIQLVVDGMKMFLSLSGRGAERIAAMLVALAKDQQRTKGSVRLSTLMRLGGNQEVFSLPAEQLKNWASHAKQYNIMYTVVKDTDKDGMVDLFVRPEDAPRINRVVERFGIVLTPEASIESTSPEKESVIQQNLETSQDEIDQVIDEILQEAPSEISSKTSPEKISADSKDFDSMFENSEEQAEPTPPHPTQALPKEDLSENFSEMSAGENSKQTIYSESFLQGISNPVITGEWPLSYAKEDFTPQQLREIRKCFEKGLSIEQINKIAQPALPASAMESVRNVSRPSVKNTISRLKMQKAETSRGISNLNITAPIMDAGKER